MKARKFTVMILLSLVVFPLLTSFVGIYGINESPPITTMEFESELIHEGVPQEVFLVLPFTKKIPKGLLYFMKHLRQMANLCLHPTASPRAG